MTETVFTPIKHLGFCCLCEKEVIFRADGPYFRATLRCPECNTGPRHRHIFYALNKFVPNWKSKDIHESSPGWDPVSTHLSKGAKSYLATQWDPSIPFGTMHPKGYRSEDLQCQTFAGNSFDIVVAQDVFEHIFRPDLAIKEIARTLRPNGVFIATVPIILRWENTRRRASLIDGEIVHHLPAEYHGNPLTKDGSLVTIDWNFDIVSYLQHHSGLSFILLQTENIDLGIRGVHAEVLIGIKKSLPNI